MNKSAASAASPDYVKFHAVIKSAASAASLRGGRASGRLDHGFFFAIFGRASGQKISKNCQNLGLRAGLMLGLGLLPLESPLGRLLELLQSALQAI